MQTEHFDGGVSITLLNYQTEEQRTIGPFRSVQMRYGEFVDSEGEPILVHDEATDAWREPFGSGYFTDVCVHPAEGIPAKQVSVS